MTLHVDLGSTLEDFVTGMVEKGRFSSESDVLREGLRLLEEREAKMTVLDDQLARGLADEIAGRVTRASDVIDRLKTKYAAS